MSLAASQCAISIFNDYCDRDLDATGKPWRAIPSGALSPSGALLLAGTCLALWVLATSLLGPLSFLWAAVGTASGMAYDAVLKRTPWSWVPFVVAFPSLPMLAWVAMQQPAGHVLWAYPVGALLVLGIHLADTLPDLEREQAQGVSGLAHRLGFSRALLLCWGCFGITPLVAAASSMAIPVRSSILLPTLVAGLVCGGVAPLLYVRRGIGSLRPGFYALSVAGLLFGTGWITALALA